MSERHRPFPAGVGCPAGDGSHFFYCPPRISYPGAAVLTGLPAYETLQVSLACTAKEEGNGMLRAVIFDIGGVLLTLGLKEYLAVVKQELGAERFEAEYPAAAPLLEIGAAREEDVWGRIAGRPIPYDRFDAAFAQHFRPIPQMLAFAAELRRMGLKTAILSNTVPSHVRVMRTMGFLDDFAPVALSCEIGLRKPDPAALGYVLDRLGLPPEQVAFIDDLPVNVEAAQRLGVRSVLHTGDVEATRRAILAWL